MCLRKALVGWGELTCLLLGLSSAFPDPATLPSPYICPSCPLSPSLSLFPGSSASPFLPSLCAISACPFFPSPYFQPFPSSPQTHPHHVIVLNSYFPSNLTSEICPHCPLSHTPPFSFISPLYPSFQSRNGQVYLWGDTQLGPHRPACPLLATPDGPAHSSPRPAGHALCHLPLQLHRPQACTLLGSTTCLPRAAAGLGSLHCQDGSG